MATIHHGGPHTMVDVKVAGGGTVTATDGHPFWNATTRQWTRADHLKAGQELLTTSGAKLTLTAAAPYPDVLTAYNLTITTLHTYYVVGGTESVLVHSCGPVANSRPGDLALELMEADLAGVSPLAAGSSDFARVTSGSGDFLWTVGESGDLNIVAAGQGIHHTVASGGAPVMAAGQISIRNGLVKSFDNMTGHYTPCSSCAGAFIQRGVGAFGAAGVRIPLRAIKDYGGRAP